MIMSNSIAYLTSRANFLQVSPEIPITKQRNPEKYDPPDVFNGMHTSDSFQIPTSPVNFLANQKEMVTDLIVKAKQIEYLINSLPEPEPEEEQVSFVFLSLRPSIQYLTIRQAKRLKGLEEEMQVANAEYIQAVNRASW